MGLSVPVLESREGTGLAASASRDLRIVKMNFLALDSMVLQSGGAESPVA